MGPLKFQRMFKEHEVIECCQSTWIPTASAREKIFHICNGVHVEENIPHVTII